MLNKRGEGSKYLSVWWFLVLIFIGVTVFIGAWMYFGVGVNVKSLESFALKENLADCLLNDDGFLSLNFGSYVFEGKEFNVFNECDLSESMFSLGSPFYFEVGVYGEDGKELKPSLKGGDYSYASDCVVSLSEKLTARYYPVCANNNYNFLYTKDGQVFIGKIIILTASDQEGGVKE